MCPKLGVAGSLPVSRSRLIFILLIAAACAVLWALAISVTGGFVLEVGRIRVSSRNHINPLILAIAASAAAWILAPRRHRRQTIDAEFERLVRALESLVPPLTSYQTRWAIAGSVAVIATAVVTTGMLRGAFVAGGPDSYGYVSQARLWTIGIPRVPLPDVGPLPEGISRHVLMPLGYRLAPDEASLVPTYSPGFPLQMAAAEWIAGPGAMFYVMPVLAGVAIWTTYVLGTMLAGNLVGVIAALLLATSPAFLSLLTHMPMSDIPTMAWWTLAFVFVPRSSRISALVAGCAVGVAILTRPNLAPLALVPAGLLAWNVAAARAPRPIAIERLVLFALAPAAACLAIGSLNNHWYGSPLASGYGPLAGALYRWDYLWPNITQYAQRMVTSQSPVVLLAVIGPVVMWRDRTDVEGPVDRRSLLVACISFAVGVYACYACYIPLDTWWTVRFLFPAFPMLFVFVSAALIGVNARLRPHARWPAVLTVLVMVTIWVTTFARSHGAFESTTERRYATVGEHIAQELPPHAVLFTMLHSGSAQYYSGRLSVRYDFMPPDRLDAAVEHFRHQGYIPYFLLDDDEKRAFVERFSAATPLGKLDWQPVAAIDGAAIYDPADAPRQATP